MKLHLPTMLRKALLACFAAVSAVTFATGSAWADTYNLLTSQDNWELRCGQWNNQPVYNLNDDAPDTISAAGWVQALATHTAEDGKHYTVDATNSLTFTITLQSTDAGNAVSAVALVGAAQTLVVGTPTYNSTSLGYAISPDVTADVYLVSGENWDTDGSTGGMPGAGVTVNSFADVARTTDAYTIKGVVTLADGNYTLDLSLNDTEVASDIALGNAFDIKKVIFESDGGTNTLSALTIDGIYGDIPTVTIVGNGANDKNLINTPLNHRLILNLNQDDGNTNDFLCSADSNSTATVANDVEIQSCIITNGYSSTTYNFTGKITGSGVFEQIDTGTYTNQTYVFSGDMSQYSGNMKLANNNTSILKFDGNTSGTGTITISGASDKLVVAGATMNNSAITATNLELSGASSFAGAVSVDTLLTLGADVEITLGADASLTLGDGALIDLSNATFDVDEIGNRTYSVFAEGSVGTHNLTDLTADMIKDPTVGWVYAFADGAITMSMVSKELFYGDGTMTWNDETDNTPFTKSDGAASAFAMADIVTFNGTGTANVTLGENITAASMTVADTATVNLTANGNTLTSVTLDVDGTLNYTGSGLSATTLTVDGTLNYNVAEGEATMGNTIAGTGTLQKTGEGTLNMGGLKSSNITTALHVSEGVLKFTDPYNGSNGEEGVSTPHFLNIISKLTTSGTGKLLIDGDVAYNRQSGSDAIEINDNVEVAGLLYVNSWTANCTYNVVSGGQLTVGNRLYLSNSQIMNVSGGTLNAGSISLGHGAGAGYTSKLNISDGGVVKTGAILLRHNNASTITMTGGELEFTPADANTSVIYADNGTSGYNGNAVADASNLNLSFTGGKLVAKDSSWVLRVGNEAANVKISGVTIETAADKTATLAGNINFTPAEGADGTITKTGAGTLALDVTAGSTISKLAIQGGYVSSAKAITLSALEITDGGLAYDLSSYGLITAANYSGALTLNLSNGTEGDYDLFQGATNLTAEQVSITGLDSRLNVTKKVTDGLVSIHIGTTGAAALTWDTNGADNVWSAGGATNWDSDSTPGADTVYIDGDTVTFAGEGEEISISGDVAPASVTVSGAGYSFAGTGKITGDASLTVENGGVLEIKALQRYTGGTTVKAGGELILSVSDGWGSGALKGDIDVLGKLKLNVGDATGWGNSENNISSINIADGGEMHVAVTDNQTAAGLALNLSGGRITGIVNSNIDLYYGGGNKYASITASAAAGATADAPTVSTISGVSIGLRQHENVITVADNARLEIESSIINRDAAGLGESPGSAVTVTKAGLGELVLSGENTYTQATTVAAGTLTLADGGVLNSVVTVDDGATFKLEDGASYRAASIGGSGSVVKVGAGVATLTAATTISSLNIQEGFVQTGADTATVSTLTVADGAGFVYDLALGQKKVVAESFDGPITLKLLSLADGTFELLQGAAGLDASDVIFEYGESSRVEVTKSVENGLAKLTVKMGTNNLHNLLWNTNGDTDDWGAGGATNWTSDGADEQFLNGDSVTFAGTGETITVSGTVSPAAMTVTGTGYVLEGTGSIGGTGALTVAAGAEATISTVNSFTGGTTIAEGATLTITKAKALGTYADLTNATVLGKVSGAGTLVINLDSETSEAVAKGGGDSANMGSFTGVVDVQRGQFYVGERNNGTYAGAETVFNASKVIVREDGALWTHFGDSGRTLTSAVDLMSGAELRNRDGSSILSGNIRFNITDPSATTPAYDSNGVVLMTQFWNKTIELSGLLEGDGTVQIKTPEMGGKGVLKLTGSDNTFAGTYEVVKGGDNNFELRLGSQTAAQNADIKLSATDVNVYLLLDSDATINGLYGAADGENAVQAQGGNRTLTVTEGDFGANIMNSGSNVLSLTKQGAADTTLILRGANTYTGATTINGGTLELAAGATMGALSDGTAPTAITVNAAGTLKVNAGTYANSITGVGTIAKAGTGSATLSGIAADFAGTIDVQAGTLVTGASLSLGNNSTLKLGADGTVLNAGALTLGESTLALDLGGTGTTDMAGSALTLTGDTALVLSNVATVDTTQESTLTLLTNVGSLANTGTTALDYFSSITGLDSSIDVSTLGLQLVDGNLQLVIPEQSHYLVWGEGTGTWAADQDFTADDEDFTTDADVQFGALTAGESDTVSISGAVSTGKVLIDAGEGKTYIFSAADTASGIASATSITINSGTASFGAGTLDMTEDTTLTVNDGGTLSLANGAIADASKVGIELNDGSTLSFANNHADTFAAKITVADGATVNLVNNNVNVGMTLTNVAQGEGETATFNLSGANFSMDSEDLHGTVNIGTRADGTTPVNVNLIGSSTAFDQNFTGVGSVTVVKDSTARLSGTNTYSGQTIINGNLIVLGSQALSDNTTMAGGSKVYLATAADGSNGEYTINRDFVSGASNIAVYVGLNADDISGTDAVSGVKLTLGSDAFLKSSIFVRSGNELIVADGADINDGQQYNVESGASMTLQGAVADTVAGAGTVKIDGDITWNNANKTYTGETQVLAGSTLTAAAPLTSGAGKVQVMEDGAMIITNSADWANKVYGAGTLVLVNGVDNLDAIVDGAATDTLSTAYVGMPVQTFGTTDVDGVLSIDDAAAAASAAKITDLVVNAGSSVNVSTTGGSLKIGQNLSLSGAGDAAATAGTAEAAALAITTGSGETKISSNITLAADTTIYAGGTGDHRLNGSFNGAGYTLTKTGSGFLGLGEFASGSTNDLSGDLNIQGGTVQLVAMGTADARQAIGKTTMAAGTKLYFYSGDYNFADADGALQIDGDATLDLGAASTANLGTAVTGSSTVTLASSGANSTGTLTLSADNDFSGTWKFNTAAWKMNLAHADAAKNATVDMNASGVLRLMDAAADYNIAALKGSVATATDKGVQTESATRHGLIITNTLTDAANATYAGAVAGTVDVKLLGGMQKFNGALGDGSTYTVSAGTLSIASTGQSGTHSYTATGGVLDMTGYTRVDAATGADTIYAVGGRVNGLNLGAGMTLADALADGSAEATGAVTLGGNTVLGAGTMNFRVTDSTNTIPGTSDPYKLTDTLYQVGEETGDAISLAGSGAKTLLNISLNAPVEILDPTEENAGDGYRDHTLISGLTLADASAAAGDFFATNLDNVQGSTSYSLHFVQNAGNSALYDLVLRAVGSADTLFWSDVDGGTWEAADQTPDSWVQAQTVDGVLTPGTTTADFEQMDYVVFGDLTDAMGTAVTDVTITVADAGVQIGNMTVQGDTTNYTFEGGEIGSVDGNTGATLTKTGASTLTLKGANGYDGVTTITGGTVIAQNKAALSTTAVNVSNGALLVLDYAAATDADKALAAEKVTLTGATLRAQQSANATLGALTADAHLQAVDGTTLTVTPTANGTGYLYINKAAEGYTGTALTGTVQMNLSNYGTYVQNGISVDVAAGKLVLNGTANDVFKTNSVEVAEGATMQVIGGMTASVNGFGSTAGTIELKDASKLEYRDNAGGAVAPKIVSEGATLQMDAAAVNNNAVLTIRQGGLTVKGTGTDAAADTTLKGGTWVLNTGAVAWDSAATGALALGANTTVKVNDDTLKNVKVNANNAVLTTAKADAAALSVDTITVGNGGKVQDVNLTITGTGSKIQGAVAGVTVNQAGTVDLDGTPALTFASAAAGNALRATLGSLDILSGRVQVPALANPVIVNSGAVTINGANAMLDLSAANKLTKADGTTAVDITINAGGIQGAQAYNGLITVDDKGTAVADGITLKNLSNNATVKLDSLTSTATGLTTLKGMQGLTLADGATLTLSSLLEEGKGNLMFDFADSPTGTLKLADDATLTINVNDVLGDVLDAAAGSVTYTLADADATGLAAGTVFDAALKLYNIKAEFTADGNLVLSQTSTPLGDDDIYRSSEDNVDGTQWAGNGPDVYSSSEPYASVYIDKDTVIDLTEATPTTNQAADGLVLSNLIGRGNGANLTIEGDGDDLVTINNNLAPSDVDKNVKALSFNGDIDVTGTNLQIKNTVATAGAPNAGELDPESVYLMNGALTTDEDSMVTITSGILKLNGKGSNASELQGGVTVENVMGQLQVSGEAALGGTLQVSDEQGLSDMTGDLELLSGGKVTLLDGTVVDNGFDILGAGEGKEILSVAKDATATLSQATYVEDVVLDLQEGSTLVMNVDENTNKYGNAVEVDGLTGTGALQGTSNAGYWPHVHITPQQDSTFSGDLSDYEGFIHVNSGKGTQTFDKVTTATDSEVELDLAGKSVINVAEENGNKTLNLRLLKLLDGSDTTVEMNTDSGTPAIRINGSSATMEDDAALTLSSAAGDVLSADDDLLFMEGVGNADLALMDGKSITLDITDNAFRRLNETAKLVVEGDKVYVDLAASETNRYEDAASDSNAKAGAELLWNVDPSKLPDDSALKAVDNAVASLLQNGNRDAAERALAATAGAGTAVLGSAFSADVERQLRAIRNRTTTMGVNQCEVNEGMPYVNAWINAEGDHREMDADGLAAGYTMDSWGGTVGFDVDITNHLTMGLAVTAMYGDLEADSADRAEGDFDTQYVSLFARVAHQAWTHTFVATLGRADVTLNRTVSVPGGSYETSGDTDGMAYGFMYEVARTFSLSEDGSTCWQPVFNVAWRHSSIDGYTESGADNALAVGEQDMNVLTFGAGARLQTVMGESLYNRASIFEARAMVKVDAGDREGEADVALLEGTTSASVKSAEIGAVGVEIGAGVTIPVGLNAGSIFIDGSAEFRSGYSNVNGTVGYRINF